MKKFIGIVFIVGLLASVGTVISVDAFEDQDIKHIFANDVLYFIDNELDELNIGGDEIFSAENNFFEEDFLDLEDDPETPVTDYEVFDQAIENIDLANLNGSLLLEKGDQEAIEIHNPNKRDLRVDFSNGKLFVDEKVRGRNINISIGSKEDTTYMVITSKNPENINFSIENINGIVEIKNQLESLAVDNVDGILKVSADKSFDLSIDNVNGSAKFKMKDLNALIKVDHVNGLCKISGEKHTNLAILSPIEKTLGTGENLIEIGNINGLVDIGQ